MFLALLLVGCNSLPQGRVDLLNGRDAQLQPSPIVLLRGWRDLWSEGIDRLADRLRADAASAAVYKESQWADVNDALVARARSNALPGPVVLVGFSYGGDDAIEISRRLRDVGRPVDLLVLIDPVTPAAIPPTVRRCVNFYQSNGAWDAFPWLRGVPVRAEALAAAGQVVNIDLRERPDLLDADTAHRTIAGSAKVHAAIVAEVRGVMRSGPATSGTIDRTSQKSGTDGVR